MYTTNWYLVFFADAKVFAAAFFMMALKHCCYLETINLAVLVPLVADLISKLRVLEVFAVRVLQEALIGAILPCMPWQTTSVWPGKILRLRRRLVGMSDEELCKLGGHGVSTCSCGINMRSAL